MKKLVLTLPLAFLLGGCFFDDNNKSTSDKGEQIQEENMKQATAKLPVPETNNYNTRKSIIKWMERMDDPSKIFYIYILGDNGNYLRYHTANTRPISTCSFLTPPDRVEEVETMGSPNPAVVRTSPALDGVYYKGGDCSVFFFTADTDAFVQIPSSVKYITYDQPLSLDVQEVKVGISSTEEE